MRQVFDPLDFPLPFPPAGLGGFAGLFAFGLVLFTGLPAFLGIGRCLVPLGCAGGGGTSFLGAAACASLGGPTAGFVEDFLVDFDEAFVG